MCGISGIINIGTNNLGVAAIKAMTDIVKHRGPDDAGYVLIDSNSSVLPVADDDTPAAVYEVNTPYRPVVKINHNDQKDIAVALGHRRLAILDLSPFGHCPMSYSDGRYWITFNGEIYNFSSLKEELILLGHCFISHTDTEVVLAAYAQWGAACLQRFHGMWAFAVYDVTMQEIFLARDRFGIKPMYYWATPGKSFCFASEIKQFTVLPGWKAILNNRRAYDYLVYNMTDHTDETMFAGVFQVPAGHYCKYNVKNITIDPHGRTSLIKWYEPRYTGSTISFTEAAENFGCIFRASVKKHMVSDVPLGAALSGGLDSSSMVCEMDSLLKDSGGIKQKTFSYSSSDERYNERKWIDEVLKQVSADAYFVEEKDRDIINTAIQLIWYNDEPNQSQSELATYYVYRLAKDNNIKVLISGQGADEYLSGYKSYRLFRWAQLFKKGKFKRLAAEIKSSKAHINYGLWGTYTRLLYFFMPGRLKKIFRKGGGAYKATTAVIDLKKLGENQSHPYDDEAYADDSIFKIAFRNLFYNPLPKYLRYEDRMSMANSVEARVPFLDHELVEFTIQQKADYLDAPGEQKRILLHGLKNILPPAILSRKDKIGFVTSEEKWVRKQMTPAFRQLLQEAVTHSRGILKPEALLYFDSVVDGTEPFNYNYWRLIAFGTWMKTFDVQLNS